MSIKHTKTNRCCPTSASRSRNDEFFVLIGSSGCGKTTLLKMINKLNSIDQGEVLIDGISVERIPEVDLAPAGSDMWSRKEGFSPI